MFFVLQKVYKKINPVFISEGLFSGNVLKERWLYSGNSGYPGIELNYDFLLKTLFKIFWVAPIFCLVKSMQLFEI